MPCLPLWGRQSIARPERVLTLSVTFGDSSPIGGAKDAKNVPRNRGTFLIVPSFLCWAASAAQLLEGDDQR